MTVRCRPWLPNAEHVATLIARGNEKDDEFGSVKERRTTARREAKAHGHRLHPWSFQGSRRWTSYCAECKQVFIVDDACSNFGGRMQCGPCVVTGRASGARDAC
jgi:hypothetical protein